MFCFLLALDEESSACYLPPCLDITSTREFAEVSLYSVVQGQSLSFHMFVPDVGEIALL